MTTSTKHRIKRPLNSQYPQTPEFGLKTSNYDSPTNPTSSTSTLTSVITQYEPPLNLFPSKSDLLNLLLVLALAAAVFALCTFFAAFLYRAVTPFCDSNLSDSDYFLPDSCKPCPTNGRCYNGHLECNQGYRKYGDLCLEDGDIYQKSKKLMEWTKDHLCKEYAHYMCEGSGAIWVSEDNLMNMLDKYSLIQDSPMDVVKNNFIRERALEDISGLMDTRTSNTGIKELKCPDILAETYKPMSCCFRQWIAKNIVLIVAVCALFAGSTLLLVRIRRRWYQTKRVEDLYYEVCDTLEANALMSRNKSDREPWLVASRLRDHLLSPWERKDPFLWKMVEEMVESDSRLDCYPKLVKGESKVVWEWQVEGSLSSSRRKKMETCDLHSVAEMKRSDKKQQSVEIALDYSELRQMS